METGKKGLTRCTVIITGLLVACAVNVVAQKRDKTDQVPVLKRLQAEWHRAYVVSDSAKLEKLLSPQATVIRSSGLVIKKPQILNYYRTRDVSDLTISTREQEVKVQGDLAVINSQVKERDKGLPYNYHVTDVLERRKSAWQIVQSQWTVMPGQWDKIHVDSAQLNTYSGTYESSTGKSFTISARQDQITLLSSKGRTSVFVPRSDTQFFIPGEPDELLFIKGSGEQAPHFVVLVSGVNTTVFQRKK